MTTLRKTTRTSLPRQPTPIQSQQPHVLVESLAVDDEGSTPRNEEHSIPREQFHPDLAPIIMVDIKRIAQ